MQPNWSKEALGNKSLCTFEGTNATIPCFEVTEATIQKVRQCDQDESVFRIIIIAVVVVSNLASFRATWRLNKIINYVEFYKKSKACCATKPILHKAAIVQLIKSNEKEDVDLFDQIFQKEKESLSIVLNQPSSGRYPLHIACDLWSHMKVVTLLRAGAEILPDNQGVKPDLDNNLLLLESSNKPEDQELAAKIKPEVKKRLGICHVIEDPALLDLLKTWDTATGEKVQSDAERAVVEKFGKDLGILVVPLPVAMMEEERGRMREIVKRWSNNHTATQCEYSIISYSFNCVPLNT